MHGDVEFEDDCGAAEPKEKDIVSLWSVQPKLSAFMFPIIEQIHSSGVNSALFRWRMPILFSLGVCETMLQVYI